MSDSNPAMDPESIFTEVGPHAADGQFGQIIGPVYSTQVLMVMWQIDVVDVARLSANYDLLALKVQGEYLCPQFQFDGSAVRADIMAIVKILRSSADPFTIAQWLRTPIVEAGCQTPIDMLDSGERRAVELLAMGNANRWAG